MTTPSEDTHRGANAFGLLKRFGPLLFLLVLMVGFTIMNPNFLNPVNLFNVLRQISITGLIALGMTFVILTAGIDLSVGSLLALCGMIAAVVAKGGTANTLALESSANAGYGWPAALADYRKTLSIRMASPDQRIDGLSGGNQQKVILARWLARDPKVLIVDEPTRGVDVGAKAEVHQILVALASRGIAVLMISSELPEILAVSDRIVTMRQGRITGEMPAHAATEENLMALESREEASA